MSVLQRQVFTWTNHKADLLARMWVEGATAGAIAEKIGVSRSAVIGRAHRMKLPRRANPVVPVEVRFERLLDLVADQDMTVPAAAVQAGLRPDRAVEMWRAMCRKGGRQYA